MWKTHREMRSWLENALGIKTLKVASETEY